MKIPDQFAAKLLDGIRPREREILGLLYFDQFEVPDIAHLLGVMPDSVSGHLSKGVRVVSRIIEGDATDARGMLAAMGELLARAKPKQTLQVGHGSDVASVAILPHREIMGCAVRAEHTSTDITRYFVVELDGKPVTTATAGTWLGDSAITISLAVRRAVLAAKRIKPTEKFDDETSTYMFPFGFGTAELYFERDFDHKPLVLPLPPGESVLHHYPPVPIRRPSRSAQLPHRWPLRVMDLGEHRNDYAEGMSLHASSALRNWSDNKR